MGAEQPLNAKFVVEGLGAGIPVSQGSEGRGEFMTVGRDVICDAVKKLMNGDEGRKARERTQALGIMARQAVEKDPPLDEYWLVNFDSDKFVKDFVIEEVD
ncbi:hypothetical protein F0562_022701 [Nyssa sinensis]|uniref:Uncharacterized protein n=1 Tax=Nyssa sinensis TaxID=561372 RepID=A0A5J5BFP5_9ASTE|nr:hypothetical protein F0562_022701 [Nyssa sinensis]